MKRSTRRVIFLIGVAIFFCASYAVLLYAQGYTYDFSNNRFSLTGTLYVRANTNARVYLNDELKGTTSFIGNSFNISGLEPGSYTIRLEQENHSVWQKQAIVEDGMLTEFSRIMILPTSGDGKEEILTEISEILYPSPSFSPSPSISPARTVSPKPRTSLSPSPSVSISPELLPPFFVENGKLFQRNGENLLQLSDKAEGFVLSKNKRKLLWWNSNEIWVMYLEATTYQPYRQTLDRVMVSKIQSPIKKGSWFRDNDHVLIETNTKYVVIEIDTRGDINTIEFNK